MVRDQDRLVVDSIRGYSELHDLLAFIESYLKSHSQTVYTFDHLREEIPFSIVDGLSIFNDYRWFSHIFNKKGTASLDLALIKQFLELVLTVVSEDTHFDSVDAYYAVPLALKCNYIFELSEDDNFHDRETLITTVNLIRELLLKFSSPCAKLEFRFTVHLGLDVLDGSLNDIDLYVDKYEVSLRDELRGRLIEKASIPILFRSPHRREYFFIDDFVTVPNSLRFRYGGDTVYI